MCGASSPLTEQRRDLDARDEIAVRACLTSAAGCAVRGAGRCACLQMASPPPQIRASSSSSSPPSPHPHPPPSSSVAPPCASLLISITVARDDDESLSVAIAQLERSRELVRWEARGDEVARSIALQDELLAFQRKYHREMYIMLARARALVSGRRARTHAR